MKTIPIDLKCIYFDIVREFGVTDYTPSDPYGSKGLSVRIHVSATDAAGHHPQTTAYGTDLVDACEKALSFLRQYGWKSQTEIMAEELIVFAEACCNTMASSRMEVKL